MHLFFNLGAGIQLTSLFAAIYYLILDQYVLGIFGEGPNEITFTVAVFSAAVYYGTFRGSLDHTRDNQNEGFKLLSHFFHLTCPAPICFIFTRFGPIGKIS